MSKDRMQPAYAAAALKSSRLRELTQRQLAKTTPVAQRASTAETPKGGDK